MKQVIKKLAQKVNLTNLLLSIIVSQYLTIKNALSNLMALLSSQLDFIANNPQLLYLKDNLKNISLHVYHSKNKKVILVQLESLRKNYNKLDSSIWSKFSKKFFIENKKDNSGYFQSVFNLYNSEKKSLEKFRMELLIIRNNADTKDFNEIRSNMFASKNVQIKWNKNGKYINESLKPYQHLNAVDFDLLENLSNRSKSYINPYLCYFLKVIGYQLIGEKIEQEKIQLSANKKEIKKIAKKTLPKKVIAINNKLLKQSKKSNRKNNKKK